MEEELRINLRCLACTYAGAKGMELSTIARLSAGDWRFFKNLDVSNKTFTARKYDEVVQWFSNNWPSGLDWPSELARPASVEKEIVA